MGLFWVEELSLNCSLVPTIGVRCIYSVTLLGLGEGKSVPRAGPEAFSAGQSSVHVSKQLILGYCEWGNSDVVEETF